MYFHHTFLSYLIAEFMIHIFIQKKWVPIRLQFTWVLIFLKRGSQCWEERNEWLMVKFKIKMRRTFFFHSAKGKVVSRHVFCFLPHHSYILSTINFGWMYLLNIHLLYSPYAQLLPHPSGHQLSPGCLLAYQLFSWVHPALPITALSCNQNNHSKVETGSLYLYCAFLNNSAGTSQCH